MLAAPVRGERTKENMAKLTFVGGIHPYDGKELSKEKPIGDIVPGKELVYPLSQHIGAPAKALAATGDRVLAGQKIAESGGFVSAPVYASVSGTVKAVEPRRVASGDMVMSIVVENDEQYEKAEYTRYMEAVAVLEKCGIPKERFMIEKAEIYEQLAEINRQIRAERKKLALCREIQSRLPQMEKDIEKIEMKDEVIRDDDRRR